MSIFTNESIIDIHVNSNQLLNEILEIRNELECLHFTKNYVRIHRLDNSLISKIKEYESLATGDLC